MSSMSEIITWREWHEIKDLDRALQSVMAWSQCDGLHEVFLPSLGAPLEVISEMKDWTHFCIPRGPANQ